MNVITKAEPLRLGIAGLGVASTLFLPNISNYANTRIVAAADLRSGALDAFRSRYGGKTYDSVEGLCNDPDVDVIWVATPNQFHCAHTMMAAEAGKHIVCTKPMAMTVEECVKMCDAADRAGVKLVCGQTWSMSEDVQSMRRVVESGELGRVTAINCWFYTDWLLKPRVAEEVDESLGGGVVYRHAPHLIDTARLLAGGKVRSVRASVGRWMKERPCPGNFSAFLEFEDGTPATLVYNGYGYFDTSEFTWGIGNRMYDDEARPGIRRSLRAGGADQEAAKESMRFGAEAPPPRRSRSGGDNRLPWFGVTVVSFEHGDMRHSPNGLFLYTDEGKKEVVAERGQNHGLVEMKELYEAVVEGKPVIHDGRWATATLEVGNAITQSSKERREILLTHQVSLPG